MEKKNDVKDLKEEKDVKDEKKEHNSADAKIEALIEMGKSKGVLTYKEVMDTLDDLELDSEQIERIYDRFEALNIDVVEEMEIPDDITSDISELESDLGSTEGVAIDDPLFRGALCAGGTDKVLTYHLQHAGASHAHDRGAVYKAEGNGRQYEPFHSLIPAGGQPS